MRNRTPIVPLVLVIVAALVTLGCIVTDLATMFTRKPPPTPTSEYRPLAGIGTPAPRGAERITADNVNRMTLLTRLGNAVAGGGAAWSPDERALAFPSSYGIYHFDARTFLPVRFIDVPQQLTSDGRPIRFENVAYSKNGRLAASFSGAAGVWIYYVIDTSFFHELRGESWVSGATFNPDGTLIATHSFTGTMRIWRVIDGTMVRELSNLTEDGASLVRVALSPDWSVMATWSTSFPPLGSPLVKPIRLWRVSDGSLIRELKEIGDDNIVFSPDGTIISSHLSFSRNIKGVPDQSSANTTVRVWRVSDGGLEHEWNVPYRVFGVAVSPDASLVELSDGITLRLVRPSDGSLVREFKGEGSLAAFSPSGGLLASQFSLRVWRVSDGSLVRESKDWYPLGGVSFSADGSRLALRSNQSDSATGFATLGLWRVGSDDPTAPLALTPLSELTGARDYACPVFSPDKRLVTTANSQGLQLWRTDDGTRLREWQGAYCSTTFSPDSSMVASVSSDYVGQIWRASDGGLIREVQDPAGVVDVRFSSDGNSIVTMGLKGGVRFNRASDGSLAWEAKAPYGTRVTFSPDGKFVLFQSDKETLQVRRVSDGGVVRELKIAAGGVMTFSPDGSLVAQSGTLNQSQVGDDAVRVWRVRDWNLALELRRATGNVVFSPDGALMATRASSELGLLQLWRVSDGKLLREFRGQRDYISSITFSPDGRMLMTISNDGTLAMWGIPGN
jgi:WD40 repeat protein